MLIRSIDQVPLLDAEALQRVTRQEFGEAGVRLTPVDSPYVQYQVTVDVPGTLPFRVACAPNGTLDVDGTDDQNARIASAVRCALSRDVGRVVAITDDASMYVDLTPGISPREIMSVWKPVSEGGFEPHA